MAKGRVKKRKKERKLSTVYFFFYLLQLAGHAQRAGPRIEADVRVAIDLKIAIFGDNGRVSHGHGSKRKETETAHRVISQQRQFGSLSANKNTQLALFRSGVPRELPKQCAHTWYCGEGGRTRRIKCKKGGAALFQVSR